MAKQTGPTSSKWGVWSLIIAIIGLLFIAGLFLGIVSIFCGYQGLKKDKRKLYSRVGIIIGIICVILGIIWMILFLIYI